VKVLRSWASVMHHGSLGAGWAQPAESLNVINFTAMMIIVVGVRFDVPEFLKVRDKERVIMNTLCSSFLLL
jgi:hypothetical protein